MSYSAASFWLASKALLFSELLELFEVALTSSIASSTPDNVGNDSLPNMVRR